VADVYVLNEPKLIFLAQPRTASQATAELLCQLGATPEGTHHEIDLNRIHYLRQRGFIAFSTVRNHWDALVSWWYFYRARRFAATFESWLDWAIVKNGHSYFRPGRIYWNQPEYADTVLRFETIDRDLELLLPGYVLPRKNVTAQRHPYQIYYTPTTRDIVGGAYRDEIEKYGYEFEGEPLAGLSLEEQRTELWKELADG
jgi:hypothetical protein